MKLTYHRSNRKLKNSYVYIYTFWEQGISYIEPNSKTSYLEKLNTTKIANEKNKLIHAKLKKLGTFPMQYNKFRKLQQTKNIDKLLNDYPDLALKFVFKISGATINSEKHKIIDSVIVHGNKFTKLHILQDDVVTIKIKYDENGKENLSKSRITKNNSKTGQKLEMSTDDLLQMFKNMNQNEELFEKRIFEMYSNV